jgi:hypothetical protein
VNAFPDCIVFYLSIGKRNPLAQTTPKCLDTDSRKCDSQVTTL